jgi:hypothetical protein
MCSHSHRALVFQHLERPQVDLNYQEKTTIIDDWSYVNGLLDEIKLSLPMKNFSESASSDCRDFELLQKIDYPQKL